MRNTLKTTLVAIGLATGLLALAACGLRIGPPAPTVDLGTSAGSSEPATNSTYEKSLNAWLDRPEEDLVAAWGVPERSQHLSDGGQVFEYRHIDGSGTILCSTLFTSDVYGKIRIWSYRGVDCQAPLLGDYGAAKS
jgi:hypothetical protein